MEKITNIEIKNFKSIRHQKIDGCKRINVFVGKPNVGKSNILEALSGFAIMEKPSLDFKDFSRFENDAEIFFEGNVAWSSTVVLNENLLLSYAYEDSSLKIKCGKFNTTNSINYFQIKKYNFNNLIRRPVSVTSSSLNFPFGENLPEILQYNPTLRKEISELFKIYNLKLLLDNGGTAIRVVKTIDEETIFSVPFFQIADTLQKLILYRAAIKSNKNAVLLFEEPESHMYPPYISKFTSDIIFDENDNQYFIATHNPYVLNDFMEDAKDELSIYLLDYKNGETIVYRLDDEEMHIAYQFGYDFFMNIENFIPHTAHEKV